MGAAFTRGSGWRRPVQGREAREQTPDRAEGQVTKGAASWPRAVGLSRAGSGEPQKVLNREELVKRWCV